MPPPSRDSLRRAKANEAAHAKQKQLEAYAAPEPGALTTHSGVVVPDNHSSLKAGERGPLLAEDFILREKLARFEHERIPERVVWARGAGAHGWFELTRSLVDYTSADFLQEPGRRTPVFARFSQMTGSQGCADTVRDVRGFAVKFYTREGNWDFVGSSIPVAFVQDAMKFPDFVHAVKAEPHHGMPQGCSAHDTFWDFVSLVPESTHALMWLMSDHALPRSWRMMDGFGVHTFRFVNAHGAVHWVRFRWKAKLGRHALAHDEALALAGCDPDFLRRDLWEAIAAGHPAEWELSLQLVPEGKVASLGIDLLDPTKLLPEEIVPPLVCGRLVLDRNPDDHFAECEQVAFHPGHLVPGIEFSNDPLLQGRLLSYSGSQIARLGGPNYTELPVNRPTCPVHTLGRGGAHRMAIGRGAVSYEPSTLATGNEVRTDGGEQGFQWAPDAIDARKTRARPASFDDHFSHATLFWNSLGAAEKEHLACAFQNGLAKCELPAIRQRVVDNLAHVDARLARKVAEPLGITMPDAKAAAGRAGFRDRRDKPLLEKAPSLSMEAPGSHVIATRRVAVLVAPGVEIGALRAVQQALQDAGAVCRILGERAGSVATAAGQQLPAEQSFCSLSSAAVDAVIVPGGAACAQSLVQHAPVLRFIAEAYRHGKAICVIGEGADVLARALGLADAEAAAHLAGVVVGRNDAAARAQLAQDFVAALARHRHWSRQHSPTTASW